MNTQSLSNSCQNTTVTNTLQLDNIQIRQDSEGRYCLNDLHKAAGGSKTHQLANWARRKETDELVDVICHSADLQSQPAEVVREGVTQRTYVCEDLAIDYAAWVSPEFKLKVYRAFKQVATGKPKHQPQALTHPDFTNPLEAAKAWIAAEEGRQDALKLIEMKQHEVEEVKQVIEQLVPKVEAAKSLK